MNAQEYADKYNQDPETITEIEEAFFNETCAMAHARRDPNNIALIVQIFEEQDRKWREFVELTGENLALHGYYLIMFVSGFDRQAVVVWGKLRD